MAEEYERKDFIDDGIKIDFPIPSGMRQLILEYESFVAKGNYPLAIAQSYNIETSLKNDLAAGKLTPRQAQKIGEKYRLG